MSGILFIIIANSIIFVAVCLFQMETVTDFENRKFIYNYLIGNFPESHNSLLNPNYLFVSL